MRTRSLHWTCGLVLAGLLVAFGTAEPAPRFNAKTVDGEKFNNENIKGKVVLLQFWATWCQYCKSDEGAVDTIAHEFAGKGLVVLAINAGESKRKAKDYLSRSPRACKIVLMEDTNLAAMFAAKAYPVYVLIDREGNIAGIQRGAGGEENLRMLLRKAGIDSPSSHSAPRRKTCACTSHSGLPWGRPSSFVVCPAAEQPLFYDGKNRRVAQRKRDLVV